MSLLGSLLLGQLHDEMSRSFDMNGEHATLPYIVPTPMISPSNTARKLYAKLKDSDIGLCSSYVDPDFDVWEETDNFIIISAIS